MSGPLPNPQRRRRNQPTKPAVTLPARGRVGRPPKCPLELGDVGKAWWKWAWATPQATRWDTGAHYAIAHRAQLEDDLSAIDDSDKLVERIEDSILRILDSEDPADVPERLTYLGLLIGKLKSLGGGRLAILKEIRELDKRLGLDPKAMAELRWVIEEAESTTEDEKGAPRADNVRTLRPRK